MADEPSKPADGAEAAAPEPLADDETTGRAGGQSDQSGPNSGGDRGDRSITDFVRRAVSAGVGAAARSKDDIVRVAAGEMRNWLDRLNLDEEVVRALAKMVIEVKTEIRFRPTEDGKLTPEATNDIKLKPGR